LFSLNICSQTFVLKTIAYKYSTLEIIEVIMKFLFIIEKGKSSIYKVENLTLVLPLSIIFFLKNIY